MKGMYATSLKPLKTICVSVFNTHSIIPPRLYRSKNLEYLINSMLPIILLGVAGPVFASRLVELSALIVEDLEKVVLNQPHASKLANELPVTRGMESGVSDSTRPTDVLCFIILCITPIFIWLGVVWARRLYSQLFRKHWQANRIQGIYCFSSP